MERGESLRKIAERFCVGLSTVSDIFRSRRQLTDVVHFDIKLYIDNFVASSGWLRNYKSRHGIRELKIHGEKLSADSEGAAIFTGQITSQKKQNVYSFASN
ncbi:hypothetical protein T02_13724 [Trichinella nativa]|uniref:HTH CENPB-type domain-containing protein n=1 Tax=Trichinella nativa TaxID=6335 RepID=A0A0V1L8V8_9BILA|nr:hypothetical protein T02_13724 [Trichinella nativa]